VAKNERVEGAGVLLGEVGLFSEMSCFFGTCRGARCALCSLNWSCQINATLVVGGVSFYASWRLVAVMMFLVF
jgi:hypothetical protein